MSAPLVLKVSVNVRLKNKDDRRDIKAHAEGWQNVEITSHDLAFMIGKGAAYTVQVKDGARRRSNFVASDVASVDIDEGMRVEEALVTPFCLKHLTILYRTPSHTEERHRFRLVFALERTITKASEQQAINRALAMRLGGDIRATDATRICYGSDLQPPELFEGFIPNEVIDELLAEGRIAPYPDSVSGARLGSARGRNTISRDQRLIAQDGTPTTLSEVSSYTVVHCPYHDDANASAFVKETASGAKYLHCSACQMTWWDSISSATRYDFESWDRAVEAATPENLGDLLPSRVSGVVVNIHKSAVQHLAIEELPAGITFIKSPKGSGKTTTLVSILEEIVSGPSYLDWDENSVVSVKRWSKPARILLVGHRRALIRDTCARLGLNCYLDDGDNARDAEGRKERYGVCLDSVWRVQRRNYDLIILDESEQVFAHLLAETLEHREGVFEILEGLLHRAKRVVALDADMGWISYRTISRLAEAVSVDVTGSAAVKPINIYYNKPAPARKEILVFCSREHLLADFEEQVRSGKRIFFTSNSKLKIDQVAEVLRVKHPNVKVRAITSDNSNTQEVQDFIVNIKRKIADYQVVLTSPSLGTGVDITLDVDVPPVDIVYGVFENLINTHFDIDQQLRRVRSPGEVRVWISPMMLNFETEVEAVKSDLTNEKDGLVTMMWGGELIDLAAQVVSLQRASKNALKGNFIRYKAAQGWDAVEVVSEDGMAAAGKELLDIGRARHRAQQTERVIKAKPIGQDEHTRIRERRENDDEVSEAESLSLLRSGLEAFYVQEITPELVGLELTGFRTKVRAYERIVQKKTEPPWKKFESTEGYWRKKLSLLPSPSSVPWLLDTLLSTTPVYKGNRFDSTVTYCARDLGDFVKTVEAHRGEIQNLLGKPIPKDLHKKPTSFLGGVLDIAGVKQKRASKKREAGGGSTYFYQLDAESLAKLDAIVTRRAETPHHWDFVHKLHGIESVLYDERFHETPGGEVFFVERAISAPGLTPTMLRMLKEDSARMAARFGTKRDLAKAEIT